MHLKLSASLVLRTAVLSLTVLTPLTASATTFSASGPCSLTTTTGTSPVTVMQTCTSASTGETYQGTAKSSQGHLGTFITTTGGPQNQAAFENSLASFTTDVIFSATAGSIATTINVSLNLNISGSLSGAFNTGLDWTIFGGGGAGGFSFSMDSVVQPGGSPSAPQIRHRTTKRTSLIRVPARASQPSAIRSMPRRPRLCSP